MKNAKSQKALKVAALSTLVALGMVGSQFNAFANEHGAKAKKTDQAKKAKKKGDKESCKGKEGCKGEGENHEEGGEAHHDAE